MNYKTGTCFPSLALLQTPSIQHSLRQDLVVMGTEGPACHIKANVKCDSFFATSITIPAALAS